jgi:hypothetical protein
MTAAKKKVSPERATHSFVSKAFSTFFVGRSGGLVVDRSRLHESQEFKRQLDALSAIPLPEKRRA